MTSESTPQTAPEAKTETALKAWSHPVVTQVDISRYTARRPGGGRDGGFADCSLS